MQNVTEKDLFDGYTAYTSAEELGLHDGQEAAPAVQPHHPVGHPRHDHHRAFLAAVRRRSRLARREDRREQVLTSDSSL